MTLLFFKMELTFLKAQPVSILKAKLWKVHKMLNCNDFNFVTICHVTECILLIFENDLFSLNPFAG